MKILVVTNDFPPKIGGINYYIDQIFRRFAAGEVAVIAPEEVGAEAFDAEWPHPVYRWRRGTIIPGPTFDAYLRGVATSFGADVVLFGALMPFGLSGPGLTKQTGIPFGGFTHGVEVSIARLKAGRPVARYIGSKAVLVTTVSHWTMDILRPEYGPRPVYDLLPAGIDEASFVPDIDSQFLRDRYGLGDAPVISCVSRLVERKGQDALIRTLEAVRAAVSGTRLLIVGSGPYEPELRALVAERGVDEHVVFTGEVPYDELAAHFHVGDVFATPCRHRKMGLEVEALGAVFLQASAVGRPAIGGRVGGVGDAIRDGETGLLVDPHDDAAIADALIKLLGDPVLAKKMGDAGAAWVHRDLTWDAIAERLKGLLVATVPGAAPFAPVEAT